MGLNGDDSHPSISSEPLIEGEEADRTAMPKFYLFIPLFFNRKTFLDVSSNQNIQMPQSLNLLLSSVSRLISTSEEYLKSRFREEKMKNLLLEL